MRLRPSKSARVWSSNLEGFVAGHVRAVAPDHAGQWRAQPPAVPRAADNALGLLVDQRESVRLLEAKTLSLVHIDPTEAEDCRDHIAAVCEFRTGRRRDIEIAGGVDHDITHDGLPTGFRFADHAGDTPVADDGRGKPRMQPHVDAGLRDEIVGAAFPAVGIEGGGHDDRHRLRRRAEIEQAPGRPFAMHVPSLSPVFHRRIDRSADGLHPFDHLHAEARDRHLLAVGHVIEHQHHPAGGETAKIGVALQKRHGRAFAPRGDRGGDAGRPAAHHDDIRPCDDRRGRSGNSNGFIPGHCSSLHRVRLQAVFFQAVFLGCQRTTRRSAMVISTKNATENAEPTRTVA